MQNRGETSNRLILSEYDQLMRHGSHTAEFLIIPRLKQFRDRMFNDFCEAFAKLVRFWFKMIRTDHRDRTPQPL